MSMNNTQKQDGLEIPVSDPQGVYVPQEEYQSLLAIAHQYVYLRQNLIAQGLNEATVDSLCLQKPAGDAPPYAPEQFEPSPPATFTCKEQTSTFPVQSNTASGCPTEDQGFRLNGSWQPNASYRSSTYPGGSINHKRPVYFQDNKRPEIKEWFERSAQRSVLLLNVPDGVTHGDVAAVIRGGPVLEIFLRSKDNTATVSFLHEADACAFIENCRAAGLYIKDRKVSTFAKGAGLVLIRYRRYIQNGLTTSSPSVARLPIIFVRVALVTSSSASGTPTSLLRLSEMIWNTFTIFM
ncbi:hypothetical protein FVEG_07123 [Fusarium verticillioides 7600]|uniref:Uncharacterized protein n=1 Tax=Gibberella moniliformis (strain M3125 / FGSC 7600) TaxID=334819 RepID=W7MQB4_GIBM7|nr:hypothetical protein FVEG_07123 [Fusarium verticillioides 7600]XP_018752989.1 hypothetical protein FVEG_07123 [Fusarium verticillioides 7600]EWG46797.1 hypothetical protein FVEG_07123 [Fusarium verticillioides 7600]EWG46798.1 hypothetical protein FVEG_07123 [Fusarium verticillioides 7600]